MGGHSSWPTGIPAENGCGIAKNCGICQCPAVRGGEAGCWAGRSPGQKGDPLTAGGDHATVRRSLPLQPSSSRPDRLKSPPRPLRNSLPCQGSHQLVQPFAAKGLDLLPVIGTCDDGTQRDDKEVQQRGTIAAIQARGSQTTEAAQDREGRSRHACRDGTVRGLVASNPTCRSLTRSTSEQ